MTCAAIDITLLCSIRVFIFEFISCKVLTYSLKNLSFYSTSYSISSSRTFSAFLLSACTILRASRKAATFFGLLHLTPKWAHSFSINLWLSFSIVYIYDNLLSDSSHLLIWLAYGKWNVCSPLFKSIKWTVPKLPSSFMMNHASSLGKVT